jgi:hypothetical protein
MRVSREIHAYVKTLMIGFEPRLPAKKKTTLKKSLKQ